MEKEVEGEKGQKKCSEQWGAQVERKFNKDRWKKKRENSLFQETTLCIGICLDEKGKNLTG